MQMPCYWTWGMKACFKIFFTGKVGDSFQKKEKKFAEHSKCVAPLSSQNINLTTWLIRAATQATPPFATATTGAYGHLIDNGRILMKFNHHYKIFGIPA